MSDVRALLLTDVVDSTRLSEALGDQAMAALWARHDRVARDLLPIHHGREIDKTDGFLMLFEDAADAVAYAVAYHRALAELEPPIRARAGIHLGPVILTENAPADVARGAKPLEVDGLAKPTAARVMSLALGGQTLVTPPVIEALGDAGLRVESHGHWRMKGVAEPIELFEIGDRLAPFTPPPDGAKVYRVVEQGGLWLPVREVKHNLPAERDAFVGRGTDLLALANRLDEGARLVSVLGIGGTGKTRLAMHFAWTWLGDYPGGAWFCDLSEARNSDGIASAVARSLDVPLGPGDPIVQIGHAIAGRGRCLVVLDNFEQVAEEAPGTLGHWLDRAKDAQFVATTREVLGLPGEVALALAPLATAEGVALFEARARQAKRDFALTDANRGDVEALVKELDGLPLAVELAAARVRVMKPGVILDRLAQRFKLLASSTGRHTRQATLRATLDWSWELLSDDEQAALAQVSVFEGGFTLEACEAVLALDELWPMDAVQGLVDKSLVRQADERFDLLVSVQVYAAEKLEGSGDRQAAELRHARFYASLGTVEALDALHEHGGADRMRDLRRELDNIVAACRRACAASDGALATNPLGAAWAILQLNGPFSLGESLARAVLQLDLSDRDRVRALGVHGDALLGLGRMAEAVEPLESALALSRRIGDRRLEAIALTMLAVVSWSRSQMDQARTLYEAALAVAREVGNRYVECSVLANLGVLHKIQGRMDEARVHQEGSLAAAREVGDRRGEAVALGNLGVLVHVLGRIDEAMAYQQAALAIAREIRNPRSEACALGNLGVLYKLQGRLDLARTHQEAALAGHRAIGSRQSEGTAHLNLATIALADERMNEATGLLETALTVAREVGDPRSEGIALATLGTLHSEQRRDDQARDALIEGERLLRRVGDRLHLAKLLCNLARVEARSGDLARGRTVLAEAESIAVALGTGPDTDLGGAVASARAELDAC